MKTGNSDAFFREKCLTKTLHTQLFTRGYLDPAAYTKQTDELLKVRARLTAEKDAIIAKIRGGTKQKEALEDILHYTSWASIMTRFVDRVIIYSRTEIGFDMKYGPIFWERI